MRVLVNISHENVAAAERIGALQGLRLTLHFLRRLPALASQAHYDARLIAIGTRQADSFAVPALARLRALTAAGLLTNLLEHCAENRRRLREIGTDPPPPPLPLMRSHVTCADGRCVAEVDGRDALEFIVDEYVRESELAAREVRDPLLLLLLLQAARCAEAEPPQEAPMEHNVSAAYLCASALQLLYSPIA